MADDNQDDVRGPRAESRVSQIVELAVGDSQVFFSRRFDFDTTRRDDITTWSADCRNTLTKAASRAKAFAPKNSKPTYSIETISGLDSLYNVVVSVIVTRSI